MADKTSELTEDGQAEADTVREATRARMAAKRAARRAAAARAEGKRRKAQAQAIKSEVQQRDARLKLDLKSLQRRLIDQQCQVQHSYRECVQTEQRVKYEQYLENCRCTPHLHAAPWKPTTSNVGNTFATDESLATGNLIDGGVAARRKFPRRPFTASTIAAESRGRRKPWSPPKTGLGTENILHDPRDHRPMTARSAKDYERAIKARGKKPRPYSGQTRRRMDGKR